MPKFVELWVYLSATPLFGLTAIATASLVGGTLITGAALASPWADHVTTPGAATVIVTVDATVNGTIDSNAVQATLGLAFLAASAAWIGPQRATGVLVLVPVLGTMALLLGGVPGVAPGDVPAVAPGTVPAVVPAVVPGVCSGTYAYPR